MTKTRLENFSDAVIAIILTIMVLELKVPHSTAWEDIWHLYPLFISYCLSFAFIAIYWVNHHHLLHAVRSVNSRILWSNMFLLFSLSLIPWGTAVMGEHNFEQNGIIVYTLLCLLPAIAYALLSTAIIQSNNPDQKVLRILKEMKTKEMASLVLYALSLVFSFIYTPISLLLVFSVSCMWLVPSKKMEQLFE
ncbi:MAG: hypothetical protein JW384_00344 [Nitrosomonadaceae bacterium]|nr:hypothetical protein [Nitrosomonadaceae bacterium]